MRRLIGQTFPAHGVIGEEYGQDKPDAEYVWVLDPIDGTKSFISGLPTWGTLIGLMHNGLPVYGMMSQPFTRERYFGDGKRARLRSLAPTRGDGPPGEWATRTLRTRTCASLDRATVMTTSPHLIKDDADRSAYLKIEAQARLVRYGADCYAYCALAAGFVDVVIETNLKPHDVVGAGPHRRRRRRRHHHLGRRAGLQRWPHRRGGRPAHARRGAKGAAGGRLAFFAIELNRRFFPAKAHRRWLAAAASASRGFVGDASGWRAIDAQTCGVLNNLVGFVRHSQQHERNQRHGDLDAHGVF